MTTRLGTKNRLWNESAIKSRGETIGWLAIGSEKDLDRRASDCFEQPVQTIMTEIARTPDLSTRFAVRGPLNFENHRNTMNLEPGESLTGDPDQYIVSTTVDADGKKIGKPVFIGESKVKQKFSLETIRLGLQHMDLPADVGHGTGPSEAEEKARRIVAAVITQAYSYMLDCGMEYGYIFTGEAFIFLRVPEDDFSSILYSLSVPTEDVGASTEESVQLHLSAVAQMLTFALRALKAPQRSQAWRANARAKSQVWEVPAQLFSSPASAPASDPNDGSFVDDSTPESSPGVLRRSKRTCNQANKLSPKFTDHDDGDGGDDDVDNGSYQDPDSPSVHAHSRRSMVANMPRSNSTSNTPPDGTPGGSNRAQDFCTQRCLLGLIEGGDLDPDCPNVCDHGTSKHRISQATFVRLVNEQLCKSLDDNVYHPYVCGAKAALLYVRLASYGYLVAAKCTSRKWLVETRHEISIYNHLRSIQGRHVPVYLGCVDLNPQRPYLYDGLAKLTRFMLLGYAGQSLVQEIMAAFSDRAQNQIVERARESLCAVHALGVAHNDVGGRNTVWCEQQKLAMMIDFERAEILLKMPYSPRVTILGDSSPNVARERQKRKPVLIVSRASRFNALEKLPSPRKRKHDAEIDLNKYTQVSEGRLLKSRVNTPRWSEKQSLQIFEWELQQLSSALTLTTT